MRSRLSCWPLLIALGAAGGCSDSQGASPVSPPSASASAASLTPDSAQPTPFSPECRATCARLEPIGAVTELLMPRDARPEYSAVAFAGGRWYAAWGGRPSNTILVQRFTAEGHADGPALHIQGTTLPRALIATPHRGGQLILLGSVLPAYTEAAWTQSVHRLDLDLIVLGAPLLLRGPGGAGWLAATIEAGEAGGVLWTTVVDRPGVLVREIRVPPDATPGQAPPTRDWWLGADRFASRERIEGQDQLLEAAQGTLRLRALLEEGKLGAPRPLLELPSAEPRQLVLSRRIGSRLYVGAHAATSDQRAVRIQALDASSLAPVGGPLELTWPRGHLEALLDANGTPMLTGSLHAPAEPPRPCFVPLDLAARAACPVTTIALPERAGDVQVIRAIRFEGTVAGVTIAAWGRSGAARFFFTRLRCVGNAPPA